LLDSVFVYSLTNLIESNSNSSSSIAYLNDDENGEQKQKDSDWCVKNDDDVTTRNYCHTQNGNKPTGVNFINMFMRSFYTCRSQKCKRQSHHQCLIVPLGSLCIKAACKMLVKSTPDRDRNIRKTRCRLCVVKAIFGTQRPERLISKLKSHILASHNSNFKS